MVYEERKQGRRNNQSLQIFAKSDSNEKEWTCLIPNLSKKHLQVSTWSETRKYSFSKSIPKLSQLQEKSMANCLNTNATHEKTLTYRHLNILRQLFNSFSQQMTCFCFTLKETAARPVEALRIEWNDIDFANKKIIINHPAKGNNDTNHQSF